MATGDSKCSPYVAPQTQGFLHHKRGVEWNASGGGPRGA